VAREAKKLKIERETVLREGPEAFVKSEAESTVKQATVGNQHKVKGSKGESTKKLTHQVLREAKQDALEQMPDPDRHALRRDIVQAARIAARALPQAISELARQVQEGETDKDRREASKVLATLTIGNTTLARDPEEEAPERVTIVNTLGQPRGGFAVVKGTHSNESARAELEAVDADAAELRTCDVCRQEKPATEFVASSERCQSCQEQMLAKVKERFLHNIEG
jgi:hypothetical protein